MCFNHHIPWQPTPHCTIYSLKYLSWLLPVKLTRISTQLLTELLFQKPTGFLPSSKCNSGSSHTLNWYTENMLRNIEWNGAMTIYIDTVSYLLLTFSSCIINFPISFFLQALFPSQIIALSIPVFLNITPQSINLINNPFSYGSQKYPSKLSPLHTSLKIVVESIQPKGFFLSGKFSFAPHIPRCTSLALLWEAL